MAVGSRSDGPDGAGNMTVEASRRNMTVGREG